MVSSKDIEVMDVAQYILDKLGTIPAMKLQKLCFYAQAWSLVRDDKPLYSNRIEAWANGPVVKKLYGYHAGEYQVSEINGADASKLEDFQKKTVDKVIDFYNKYTSKQLSEITHQEDPWKIARGNTPDGERCTNEITLDSIAEYYGTL